MRRFLLGLILVWTLDAFSKPVEAVTQDDIDYLAKNLDIQYQVVTNLQRFDRYVARVTFTNNGAAAIKTDKWAIYICFIYLADPDQNAGEPGIKLTHVTGCLHKLEPTSHFKDILAGDSLTFQFNGSFWSVARTDAMPRWYVAADGLEAKTLGSTDREDLGFVADFVSKEQWKRYSEDRYDPYTPEKRFEVNNIADLGKAPLDVIPTPVKISDKDELKKLSLKDDGWQVYAQKGLEEEAAFLAAKTGLTVSTSMPSSDKNVVQLSLGAVDVEIEGQKSDSNEAYSVHIDAESQTIGIMGVSPAGVYYGIQTLLSLMNADGVVTQLSIQDAPRYEYRGMHLDVARNFMSKGEVMKLLDVMAMYKLNKFHFHLSDDEGWRLEIPGLEELTSIGSKRCHDLEEQKCILSQLGSGPGTATSGSGHYTSKEYLEILQHAKKRHIQVIPEFDMPGHGNAAVKAMLARYKRLANAGDVTADKYLLTDLNDTSKYLSVQYYTDDAINPCLESTYSFVEHLVGAVVAMHNETQPLTIFHFGGDEVATGAWTNSSACRGLAAQLGLNYSDSGIVYDLKEHFVKRVSNITSEHGLDLAGWEDGFTGRDHVPFKRDSLNNTKVFGFAWNNIWEWGGGKRAYDLANAGYKVVMTQATHLYFDHPQEPDPEERGYYWATRFTPLRKVFGFMPDDLFANVDFLRSGEPITEKELCERQDHCVTLEKKENIIGMAGALWSETVRTADQMHDLVFPRLLALAERAWHKASWETIRSDEEREKEREKDWERFANTLGYKELSRLDAQKIAYNVPPVGARFDDGKLFTRTAIPGLKVQYSVDGGENWNDVTEGMDVTSKVLLRTRSTDMLHLSRLVQVDGSNTRGSSSRLSLTSWLTSVALIVSFLYTNIS